MNKLTLILIFATFFNAAIGQNLVPNPGFDLSKGKKASMKPWSKINTIDFFINSEKQSFKDVNKAKNDKNYILRKPRSGTAYVGLRVWPKYNEYLQVSLIEPLKKGKAYTFEMWVTPSQYCNCYLKTIGASFYQTKPPYSTRFGKEDYPPQVENYKSSGIRDTSEWIRVNGVFIAEGGEKILTIGNFSPSPSKKYKRKKISFKKREAYYYIDDISLYQLNEKGEPILEKPKEIEPILPEESKPEIAVQDTTQVDDGFATIDSSMTKIYFSEGEHKLDERDYQQLAPIVEYLLENENTAIELQSYAAAGETEGDVSKLADKRSKSVQIFMNGNKIGKDRIIINNMSAKCTSDKSNETKRRECRKIELKFIENNNQAK